MRMFVIAIFLILASTFLSNAQTPAPKATDERSLEIARSMKPYLSCTFDDGLGIVQSDRRKSTEPYRMVDNSSGKQKVSVLDGYRVMFAYPGTAYFFGNAKVEQSNPQDYQRDKLSVIDEMKWLANGAKSITKNIYRDRHNYNGYESYGFDRDVIDKGAVLGVHVLFSDDDQKIITVYLLNQGKKNRRFNSIEEYQVLRDHFLDRYSACIKNNKEELARRGGGSPVDGWQGLFIDESTPQDAKRVLGEPVNDELDRLNIRVVDRWLSSKQKDKAFRKLTFRRIEKVDKVELFFLDDKLVMMRLDLGPLGENWSPDSLNARFSVNFIPLKRILSEAEARASAVTLGVALGAVREVSRAIDKVPADARPFDFESEFDPNQISPDDVPDYRYYLVAVSTRSIWSVQVLDIGPRDVGKFVFDDRLRGKVIIVEIISRKLEKK